MTKPKKPKTKIDIGKFCKNKKMLDNFAVHGQKKIGCENDEIELIEKQFHCDHLGKTNPTKLKQYYEIHLQLSN